MMIDFIFIIKNYWFAISGLIVFIFTLGITWQRAETSMSGVKKLFQVVDEIVAFRERQMEHNTSMKEQSKTIADQLNQHDKEDAEKFSQMISRMDKMYEILITLKNER